MGSTNVGDKQLHKLDLNPIPILADTSQTLRKDLLFDFITPMEQEGLEKGVDVRSLAHASIIGRFSNTYFVIYCN